MRSVSRGWHKLIVAMAAAVLPLGVVGCGPAEPDLSADTGAAATAVASNVSASPEEISSRPPTNTPAETEAAPPLKHGDVLAAGLDGSRAITCTYIFDEEEIRQMEMIPSSGPVTPEATIHMDGNTVHWEIPEPGGPISHILTYDGSLYVWKVPGNGKGAIGGEASDEDLHELADRMKRNAHDCEVHSGSRSVFEVPDDIAFEPIGQFWED